MSMVFDSSLHPGHKSQRLPYRNYADHATYFVTICTYDRLPSLAKIVDAKVQLTPIGEIVQECWLQIPLHDPQAKSHSLVVMPNHVHGLLQLIPLVGTPLKPETTRRRFGPDSVACRSLSSLIRSFKSAVTRLSRARLGVVGEIWQRNYFERAIRDGRDFDEVTRYITENPFKWEMDRENPEALKTKRPR
jgi:putative transposase